MSMKARFAKEEAEIARLQKELEEEDKAIEERKKRGEPMRSYRYMDLARQIRTKQRELRRAREYYEEAQKAAELERIRRKEL